MTRDENKSKAVSYECKMLVDSIYDDHNMELNEYDIKIITTLITEELQITSWNDTQWIKELSDLLEKIEEIERKLDD